MICSTYSHHDKVKHFEVKQHIPAYYDMRKSLNDCCIARSKIVHFLLGLWEQSILDFVIGPCINVFLFLVLSLTRLYYDLF